MAYNLNQQGTLTVVMERFEKKRLPRIMKIHESVIAGNKLSSTEIDFLETVLQDTQQYKYFVDQNPEFQPLYTRVVYLYDQIMSQALKNEQDS